MWTLGATLTFTRTGISIYTWLRKAGGMAQHQAWFLAPTRQFTIASDSSSRGPKGTRHQCVQISPTVSSLPVVASCPLVILVLHCAVPTLVWHFWCPRSIENARLHCVIMWHCGAAGLRCDNDCSIDTRISTNVYATGPPGTLWHLSELH